jgi:hypothetical protein
MKYYGHEVSQYLKGLDAATAAALHKEIDKIPGDTKIIDLDVAENRIVIQIVTASETRRVLAPARIRVPYSAPVYVPAPAPVAVELTKEKTARALELVKVLQSLGMGPGDIAESKPKEDAS